MKKLFPICIFLLLAVAVIAQEPAPQKMEKTLRVYEWKDLSAQFPNRQIISMDGVSVLKIENTNQTPLEVLLLTVTNSALLQKANKISTEMKYENVYPPAQRELLEKYPPRAAAGDCSTSSRVVYFVSTANWDKYDDYIWPAHYDNQTHPNEVALKLILPATGTVHLRPIKLMGMINRLNSWWSPQQSGLIGGIAVQSSAVLVD